MSSTNQDNRREEGGIAGSSARSRTRQKSAVNYEIDRGATGERERIRVARDIDVSFSDSITSSEPDERAFEDAIPAYPVPGSGDRLVDCGDEIRPTFCEDCASIPEFSRTCRRSRCPRCWKSWAFYRAKTWASKLKASRDYLDGTRSEWMKLHHVVVSPNPTTRFDSSDPMERAVEIVKRICDEIGAETGLIIPHSYRIKEEKRGNVNGHESGEGDMTWKDILRRVERDGWESTRDEYLVEAPHFHVICVGSFVEGGAVTKQVEEETGWLVERITKGPDSSVSIYDTRDLCKTLAYSLSHASLVPDDPDDDETAYRAGYRAFGDVANREPSETDYAEVDSELRAVAPTILGCDFPKRRTCSKPVEPERVADPERLGYRDECDDDDHGVEDVPPVVRAVSTGGSTAPERASADDGDVFAFASDATTSEWSPVASGTPSAPVDSDDLAYSRTKVDRCGGKLKPMRAADRYLESGEWCERVGEGAVAALEDAKLEWELLGRPAPDNPPPPD